MPSSRYNYICITENDELKKYAAQSLSQIVDETPYEYKIIMRQDLHFGSFDADEYVELEWHD